MSPLNQYDTLMRLNSTVTKARATAIFANKGASPLEDWVQGARTDLNATETMRVLNERGYDTTKLALVNTKSAAKLTDVLEGRAVEDLTGPQRALKDLMTRDKFKDDYDYQVAFENALVEAINEVMVGPDAHGNWPTLTPAQNAAKGWNVGPAAAQLAFQARLNPFSSRFGAGAIAKKFARSKVVVSQWLLMHPAWAISQVYANAMLMTVGQPQAWFTRGMRDYIDHLPSEARQKFYEHVGVPAHHHDYHNVGHGYLASLWGLRQIAEHPSYIRHLKGRGGPRTHFFGFDVRQTTHFGAKALHSKMRREALGRMEGHFNRYFVLLDDALTALGKKKAGKRAVLDEEMSKLLTDEQLMARLGDEVHSFMGDYNNFTPGERSTLANHVLFYGFMRHSAMLALWTLPVKHPVRLALLTQMGKAVERDQFQMYVEKQRENLTNVYTEFLMKKSGYTEEQARAMAAAAAARWRPEAGRLPVNMWGNYMIPGTDNVVSLRRASFIGSGPLEAAITGKPWAMLASISPAAAEAAGITMGTDLFSGQPITTHAGDTQKEPGLNPLNPLDWPKVGAVSALNFAAPARYLSQTASTLPSSERTGTSFPLPGPFNPFPEVAMNESTKQGKQYQDLLRRYESAENTPIEVLKSEMFLPGHVSTAIEVDAVFFLKDLIDKGAHIRTQREEREKKREKGKPTPKQQFGPAYPESQFPWDRSGSDRFGPAYPGDTGESGSNRFGPAYPESTEKDKPAEAGLDVDIEKAIRSVYGITPGRLGVKSLKKEPNPNKSHPHRPPALGKPQRGKAPGGLLGLLSAGIDALQGQTPARAGVARGGGSERRGPTYAAQIKKHVASKLKKAAAKRGGVPEGVPSEYRALVAKYGPIVDKAAAAVGMTGTEYLAGTLSFESGFGDNAEGPMTPYGTAKGPGQFIDSTARTFEQEFGLKNVQTDRDAAVHATALYLAGNLSDNTLYAAHNPGYGGDPIPDAAKQLGRTLPSKPIPKRVLRRARQVLGQKKVKQILNGTDGPYQLQTQELFHDPSGAVNLADGGQVHGPGGVMKSSWVCNWYRPSVPLRICLTFFCPST